MRHAIARALVTAMLCCTAALAQERLAVFEFLARQSTYCMAAAPAVIELQDEMAGRAVLLEYDFDAALARGRADRYFAADPNAWYLPFTMVGSGYRTAGGPVDYEPVYRGMLEQELARAPEAAVTAQWRRQGSALRVYVQAENLSEDTLTPDSQASIWVIVWENARIRLTDTWVRAAVESPLTASVGPGARVVAVVDTPALSGVNWDHVETLAMLERRTASGGRYDMMQAAIARAAGLFVSPEALTLSRATPSASVALVGPHTLTWTAEPDQPWLAVVPDSGGIPTTATVGVVADMLPRGTATGSVRFEAVGEGMTFSTSVTVTLEAETRLVRRRLRRSD
jgi:hypothetical protein